MSMSLHKRDRSRLSDDAENLCEGKNQAHGREVKKGRKQSIPELGETTEAQLDDQGLKFWEVRRSGTQRNK